MKLLVGLGNPGPKYAKTRHNVGFMAVDLLARALGLDWKEKFNGEWAKGSVAGEDVVLLKPMTFMNDSGRSVQAAAAFFHLRANGDEMLVLHDELDIPFGDVRLKVAGGHAGHNGLRSIIGALGADFARVRIGIGRPPAGFRGEVADFVLGTFDANEAVSLDDLIAKSVEAAKRWVDKGALAANETNVRKGKRG
jgi:PTH1 family peptidyl-tRNA hydrolase